ncbi:lymphotoxin-beta isoform X2 [Manis pentadactyla]|uniref:lymphotoxin-beta isoform X2 n=1 Tax=Manis pentadactyla TaxID=143292 RepID=UPI00255CA984|nr:lymphotoxin-beta isoform X2 [Manis pentadactyla]
MGALGLEGRGRRPQGKGCLLLAVAGATSLVTLLLAVPITVLAVLALVPQEQGRLVAGTADPGVQAQAQQRSGAWTNRQGIGWEAKKEEAFLRGGTQFSGAEGLALPLDGLYYLYCHIGYRGRAPSAGGGPPDHSVTLRSRLYRTGGAYGPGTPELLLEGAETVTPVLDPAGRHEYGPLWYTSVGFGGLVQLRRDERVYVNISHPDMVDYRRGKTFFGAVMVG